MKTPERIVQASLRLFNDQGERAVSTNHIAAHLEISPGNLYYHFANKQQIVAVLFDRYQAAVRESLAWQAPGGYSPEALQAYVAALLERMWEFRFFYRDLEHLLDADASLASRYRVFSHQCLIHGRKLIEGFSRDGVLALSPRQGEALALNLWIVLTGWVRYCSTGQAVPLPAADVVRQGCFQVLSLVSGFVQPAWRPGVESLLGEFSAPLMMHNDQGAG
ncbi:TetR/AcrR family transcriptional regulator [Pseudomonas sp. NPDC007930]|uniref:TetR/AcrR family transcriptional regulator n=1 Tax=Pseudomonas sp. NPDC007930 TaxID=3364417 RepID=UPI0036E739D7